jgi:ABC transporter substrate binding protein
MVAARAQQTERVRRIGVLSILSANDPGGRAYLEAFQQALQQLGWTDGRNVRIDYRHAAGDAERVRQYAADLVALAPDVVLATSGTVLPALLQSTRTVPIVFVCSYEAHPQARPTSAARLERCQRRGVAHGNCSEPETACQAPLPCPAIGDGCLPSVGVS